MVRSKASRAARLCGGVARGFAGICVAALLFEGCGGRAPRPVAEPAAPPVAVPAVAARVEPVATLPVSPSPSSPPAAKLDPGAVAEIDAAVAAAMRDDRVPGAVVAVGRHDAVLLQRAYGYRQLLPEKLPMVEDTVFDLASVTKPVATATSIMVLLDQGRLALDDLLSKYVPECATKGKAGITLRHLLLHVGGLPSGTPKSDYAHGRAEAIARICNVAAKAPPGQASTYTDLGFLLLEEVVRRVTHEELPAFANTNVFAPLGMHDTEYTPDEPMRARAATTEEVDGVFRIGVVHDPRAYLLGGVAGHAGLFSTAHDLSIFAQALLGGGETAGKRILSRATVATMLAPYDVPGGVRALGWGVDGRFRGEGMSPRAVGHLGWTGTALFLDPEKDLFTVVLTNRVHPDGKGDSKPLVARINTIAAQAIGPSVGRTIACGVRGGTKTGIDVLREEGFARLYGAHVGLLTNATGRARDGQRTIDLLAHADGVKLVAIFTPEHGLGSDREGSIADGVDGPTGLPIHSLYGDAFAPSEADLAGIDTLVVDVQDVGARFYTYASTMRRAMQAARDHDLAFVVLDRPNPLDGVHVGGPVLSEPARSFVNFHALPVRHGMTLGELAYLFNADDHLGVRLSVVPLVGWSREESWEDTGLPWVNPSPNLRSPNEARLYPAVGLLEATNLSVGRGTDTPFEVIGAPWIDPAALASSLAAEGALGVAFAPATFAPDAPPYAHKECRGVRLTIKDPARYEPVRTGLAIARSLHRLFPGQWEIDKLDRMLRSAEALRLVREDRPTVEIERSYGAALAGFAQRREKYLLYPAAPACVAPTPD